MHPSTTIDELFQRGNRYAMLEDDIVPRTKRTIAATLDSDHYDGSKGKIGWDDQNRGGGGGGGGWGG